MTLRSSRLQGPAFTRRGMGVLMGFALASAGAACGETDSQGVGQPASAGNSGVSQGGGTTGGAGMAGTAAVAAAGGATAGRRGSAGASGGVAGDRAVAGRGGTSSAGRGGTAGRGGVSGSPSSAGETNQAGESNAAGASAGDTVRCSDASLVWRSANKTTYTSYPDPGSEECIKYNGCMWAGEFAACDGKKAESWVAAHNIVAAFPDFASLELHDLCLRKGNKVLVVTVLDTCGDSDCDGCCTENQGSAEQLIDIESYTNERWNEPDGPIDWADLGPTTGDGCG